MAEYLNSPGSTPERMDSERRRSKNPLRNMMQHLSVEAAEDDYIPGSGNVSRRESLMRRLSRRRSKTGKSRSPSANSDTSATSSVHGQDPLLCRPCASWAADVDAAFEDVDLSFAQAVSTEGEDVYGKKEQFLMRLKGLDENKWSTTCPLCKLFWTVHVPGEGEGDYYLAALSSRDMNYLIDPVKMTETGHPARGRDRGFSPAFLGVVPKKTGPEALGWDAVPDWFRSTGMLFRTLPETQGACQTQVSSYHKGSWGREIGERADLSIARDWMQFCEHNHPRRCGRRQVTTEMPGFRLLDCQRDPPQLVEASIREEYVALSYVCGRNMKEAMPRVFCDAVSVVKGLGMRYLWVDRLSMQHDNSNVRTAQMLRMDEIFEGAALTIVAAAGEDATHGLPGVDHTAREPQPKYKFFNSDITVVSTQPDPRLTIKKSKWYTRAWTYQEALLSRRRLVFTDQQMYWECGGVSCQETLVLPLQLYHDAAEERMADFMRPGLFNAVSYMDGGWEVWKRMPGREEPSTISIWREVDQHIAQYTARDLTYDADSLRAFMGLSRRLEKTLGRDKMSMVIGMPLWAPSSSDGRDVRTRDLFALSISSWHHKDGSMARRRAQLPSWTWAGWAGAVELFSSVVVRNPESQQKERKFHSHHYVTATQLTRSDASSSGNGAVTGAGATSTAPAKWCFSPDMLLLNPDNTVAYDFSPGRPPRLPSWRYNLFLRNPLVLDQVRARAQPSGNGWLFNDVSVEARLSGPMAAEGIRGYVERHGRAEAMTVLWFVEGNMVMLLVVQKVQQQQEQQSGEGGMNGVGIWERVGKMRMGVEKEVRSLDKVLERLPLRRLGEDIVIQ